MGGRRRQTTWRKLTFPRSTRPYYGPIPSDYYCLPLYDECTPCDYISQLNQAMGRQLTYMPSTHDEASTQAKRPCCFPSLRLPFTFWACHVVVVLSIRTFDWYAAENQHQ